MRHATTVLLAAALVGPLTKPAPAQNFQFYDVTAQAGLDYPLSSNGAAGIAVGDYNGDGWLDVSLAGGSDERPQIFRNNGLQNQINDRTDGPLRQWFTNVTPKVMPPNAEGSSLAMFCDLDNDGDHDLLSVRRYVDPTTGTWDDSVCGVTFFYNLEGRFRRGVVSPTLGKFTKPLGGLALADLDGDSDLDVIFTHSGGAGLNTNAPGFYLRNDGLPNLVDATAQLAPSLSSPRRYFSVLLADFTGDLLPDLHSAIDFYPDFHCRNQGGGQLVDSSVAAGTLNTGSDMGLAIGDIDNDGDLDIYSTNINFGILYVNDGSGKFTEEADARGVGGWTVGFVVGWGTVFADLDLDMDLDLVVVGKNDPGFMWKNNGSGKFKPIAPGGDLDLYGFSMVPFDYDKDGDIDLLVADVGAQKTPHLFENRSPIAAGRHWIVIEPEGTTSNRDGVGAIVRVTAGGVTQTRPIVAGYSFKSGPPMNAHFGLADNTTCDVEITWPTGAVQTLTGVAVDRYLQVVEP